MVTTICLPNKQITDEKQITNKTRTKINKARETKHRPTMLRHK